MRILVLGATGMLGHMACRTLARQHDVFGVCRKHWGAVGALADFMPRGRCLEGVLVRGASDLAPILREVRPTAVINCIGVITQKPEANDPELLIRLNALLPHELAAACDEVAAKLVTFGTDCVFSGRRGGYTEDHAPDPVDRYGHSKLLGEVAAAPHLTLRTSVIGRQLAGTESLLEWFLAQRDTTIRGFGRAIYSGLTTRALCRVLDAVLSDHDELAGVYHVASTPISKLALLRRVAELLRYPVEIVEDTRVVCDRSLDGTRFAEATGIDVPSWEEMLTELVSDSPRYDDWRSSR